MAYYYWVEHGIKPSVFYDMKPGELMMIRAFWAKELEDKDTDK